MKKNDLHSDKRRVTNWKTFGVCLSLAIIFACGIFGAYFMPECVWRNLIMSILSACLGAVGVSMFWELISKRAFSDEILSKINISSNIEKSGLIQVEQDFRSIELEKYIEKSTTCKMVVLFGTNIFGDKNNEKVFPNLTELSVVVSDRDNKTLINDLEKRFKSYDKLDRYDTKKILNRLDDTETKLKSFANSDKKCKVNYYKNDAPILCSYYLFDYYAIMSTFSHQKKGAPVFGIVCKKGGHLYNYIEAEVDTIINHAREYKNPIILGDKDERN